MKYAKKATLRAPTVSNAMSWPSPPRVAFHHVPVIGPRNESTGDAAGRLALGHATPVRGPTSRVSSIVSDSVPEYRNRNRSHATYSRTAVPEGAVRTSLARNPAPKRAPDPVMSGIGMLVAPAW